MNLTLSARHITARLWTNLFTVMIENDEKFYQVRKELPRSIPFL